MMGDVIKKRFERNRITERGLDYSGSRQRQVEGDFVKV